MQPNQQNQPLTSPNIQTTPMPAAQPAMPIQQAAPAQPAMPTQSQPAQAHPMMAPTAQPTPSASIAPQTPAMPNTQPAPQAPTPTAQPAPQNPAMPTTQPTPAQQQAAAQAPLRANNPNSAQSSLLISELRDSMVIMKDGSFRAVVACKSINFDLMSEEEREAVEYSYQNFLNSLTFTFFLARLERNKATPTIASRP